MAINIDEKFHNYIDENKNELITRSVFGFKSWELFTTQKGVKHSAYLNILDTNVNFQDGSVCGFAEEGASEISRRLLEVGNIKVAQSYCRRELLDTFMNDQVQVAAGDAEIPFQSKIFDSVIGSINKKLETAVWTSDKSANGYFDGVLTILGNEPTVISAGATGVLDTVEDVYLHIPIDVLPNASIVMGEDQFRKYVMELTRKNLYHYDPKVDGNMRVMMPGTSTMIYGVPGLNGTDKVVAGDLKGNFYFGTDMIGDKETIDWYFDGKEQKNYLTIFFNAGVQVAFPDQIVLGTIA